MIEFRDWVKQTYGIHITDAHNEMAQRILNGTDEKESSLRRMVREYAVEKAKESVSIDDLARQIRTMSVRSNLYRMLKTELSARGWWKNRPRGKPGKF